jgi:glycosyltransferase involved in cell wall biosynthesis
MNIIGLTGPDSGCGYHRILLPLGFMNGITGYVTNLITEDRSSGWDLMIYNRLSPYDKVMDETKAMLGAKLIVDMDDYWKLPPNHMNFDHYEKYGEQIENNLRRADLVTVTNEALAIKCREFSDNVHVIPNALPFGHNQFIEDKRESDRVRIFWAGGASHEDDLRILKNPILKLKMHASKIKMVIGGYTDTDTASKKVWDRMFSSFTAGGTLPYIKLHGTKPNNYMQHYEHADIMVIPLEDTEWHACKSNLKILEAACKKVPVIVSNVAPYNQDKDCPVRWVNSQKDWFEHLNYLINNPAAREEEGNKLYEWAKESYNLIEVNKRRFELFSSIC